MKKCSVEGCINTYKCKGYCRKHYEQWFKTGDPIAKIIHIPQSYYCSVDGCKNKSRASNYCKKHYARVWRYGYVKDSYREKSPLVRFQLQTKINEETGCLEWIGRISKKQRYPIIGVKGKHIKAHRFSYESFIGPIPDGMYVLHKCDNTICCNPNHLFIGTQFDNVQDMIRKGRDNFDGLKHKTLLGV